MQKSVVLLYEQPKKEIKKTDQLLLGAGVWEGVYYKYTWVIA